MVRFELEKCLNNIQHGYCDQRVHAFNWSVATVIHLRQDVQIILCPICLCQKERCEKIKPNQAGVLSAALFESNSQTDSNDPNGLRVSLFWAFTAFTSAIQSIRSIRSIRFRSIRSICCVMDCPAILAQRVITVLTRPGCDLSESHGTVPRAKAWCPQLWSPDVPGRNP